MANAPVGKLKKKEIVWLGNHKCKHGHTYLEHYSCFTSEIASKHEWEPGSNIPIPHRIGYFDIESTGFQADFSIMLCYCIKDSMSDKIYGRCINRKEMQKDLDYNIVKSCIEDLKKFDRVVTYYGTGFDLPFLRTRALYHNLDFPGYSELLHTDAYYIVRNKFKLSRSRQGTASNILVGEARKTQYGRDQWTKALTGDKVSLGYIYDHCQKDTMDLEDLYNKIQKFSMRSDKSI